MSVVQILPPWLISALTTMSLKAGCKERHRIAHKVGWAVPISHCHHPMKVDAPFFSTTLTCFFLSAFTILILLWYCLFTCFDVCLLCETLSFMRAKILYVLFVLTPPTPTPRLAQDLESCTLMPEGMGAGNPVLRLWTDLWSSLERKSQLPGALVQVH